MPYPVDEYPVSLRQVCCLSKGLGSPSFEVEVFEDVVYQGLLVVVLGRGANYRIVQASEVGIGLGWIELGS